MSKPKKKTAIEQFRTATKLHVLAKLALDDLEWCEARPDRFTINMYTWVENEGPMCEVCLAGACLARRDPALARRINSHNLTELPSDVTRRLHAINLLRCGYIDEAHFALHPRRRRVSGMCPTLIPPYRNNRLGFMTAFRKLIDDLRAADL